MKKIFILLTLIVLLISSCGGNINTDHPNQPSSSADAEHSISPETESETIDISEQESASIPQADSKSEALATWNVEGQDLDGININLKDQINSADITIINVWGTFCGPCKYELPDLARISEDYKDKNVSVIGIASDVFEGSQDMIDLARDIFAESGVSYPSLINNQDLSASVLAEVMALPTTFIVDRNGQLVTDIIIGAYNYDFFAKILDQALDNLS